MVISGTKAALYRATYPATATVAPLAAAPNSDRTVYTVTDKAKRFLDPTSPVVVQTSPDGTNWTTATGYKLNHCGGIITFKDPQPLDTQVRIDTGAKYLNIAQVGECRNWSLEPSVDYVETTTMGDNGWKTYVQVLKSATVTVDAIYVDEFYFEYLTDPTVPNGILALILEVDKTGIDANGAGTAQRYECYAAQSSLSLKNAVDGIVERTQTLQVIGQVVGY